MSHAAPVPRATLAERLLALAPLLAPFALLFPWAAVPTRLGVGLAGPRFFVHWLTKYPSVGPVNAEVLLGILCLAAAAVLPAAAASYRLAGGRRAAVAIALAAAAVIAYLPVLVRLDVDLVMVGLLGADTLLGRTSAYEAACGPLLRALAVASTLALTIHAVRAGRRPPAPLGRCACA
ncbi:MAG: hypothetical protein WKG00_08595 [Polyangiaceae bacterium]